MRKFRWATLALLLATAASPALAAEWRSCVAGTLDLAKGRFVVLASEPFDTAGLPDWSARVLSARSHEAAFKALGVDSAPSLDGVVVRCSTPQPTREVALRDRDSIVREIQAGKPTGAPLVQDRWPEPLPAPARGIPHVPPALAWAGRHASATTRASSPARWGSSAQDFATLHAQALLAKAGLPGRRGDLERAAADGDAYAQFLLAVHPPGEDDDLVLMRKAADQGLVRAIVNLHDALAARGGTDRDSHLARLREMAALGGAHARFVLAMNLIEADGGLVDGSEGETLLRQSAEGGYAPAQLQLGQTMMVMALGKQGWRDGRDWVAKAAAQGLAEAQALLRDPPPEPAE